LLQADLCERGSQGTVPSAPRKALLHAHPDPALIVAKLLSRLQGISAPIVGAAAENASLFLVYNKIQELIRSASRPGHTIFGSPIASLENGEPLSEKARGKRREMSMGELAMAAGMAGAFASFVL
jgi:hypothetical protein